MKGPDKPKWSRAMANEVGQIFQGIRDIKGTDMRFLKTARSPNVTLYTTSDPRTKKPTECASQWTATTLSTMA